MTTFGGLCARLLRDEALEAGIDPFTTPVAAADRLAMLLERIDDLPLRHHDLRGNPSATLGAIVRRIDALKDELISAADYAAWAAALPEDATRRARARVRGAVRRPRRAARARPARSTSATSSCRPSGCCARSRTCARGSRPATGTCSSTSCRTRASPRACCCGCSWPSTAGSARSPTTTRRSTASAARRPRTCATSAPSGRTRPWSRLDDVACAPAARVLAAARAVVEPIEDRLEKDARRPRATAARSRSGAAPPSARRRRRWRPTSSG